MTPAAWPRTAPPETRHERRRFTARSSREALSLVREALGDDAVVLSTRPAPTGSRSSRWRPKACCRSSAWRRRPCCRPWQAPRRLRRRPRRPPSPRTDGAVADDVAALSMSTLSFQDYVRERLLRRRRAAIANDARLEAQAPAQRAAGPRRTFQRRGGSGIRRARRARTPAFADTAGAAPAARPRPAGPHADLRDDAGRAVPPTAARRAEPMPDLAGVLEQRMAERSATNGNRPALAGDTLREPRHASEIQVPPDAGSARRDQDMMNELRQVKGLIEERFGALAFMEKLQRQPAQARLTQKLLDCGFSPALIRKLADSLPNDIADEAAWAGAHPRTQPDHRRSRCRARGPGRRLRADRRHRRRQDHDDREDRRGIRDEVRRREPRADHARRLPRRRPRAAARLRPHPRRAGAHRARPCLARGPAGPADREEDGADRHRRDGAARQPHARAARDARRTARSRSCWSSTPRHRARRSRTC